MFISTDTSTAMAYTPDIDDLCDAISGGSDLPAVKSIVDLGLDVNDKDMDGFTPICYTVVHNRLDVFNYLMQDAGAKPTIGDVCQAI